jgi:hypothetical protein
MRRVVPLVAVALVVLSAPAGADDSLESMMESAMHAEFHGSGVVMTTWDGDSAATTYEITRTDDMSMVTGPDGTVMTKGGMTASLSDGAWVALEVADWSAWSMSERYTVANPVPTTRLGRPASEIVVSEGGRLRVRLVVDDASTVPLLTEVFDADGRVVRMSAMVEFEDAVPEAPDMPDEYESEDMMMPSEPSGALPSSLFGYQRSDTYGMDGATQSFYSDGLFSFSVFEAGRGSVPAEFADATEFDVGGDRFRRLVTPEHVWVQWSSPDHSYVLVGDLPPDHLDGVLGELPAPGALGAVMRFITGLFG